MSTILVLVRHAPTFENETHVMIGRTNPPLHMRGRKKAQAVALALAGVQMDVVITSPLRRASETATEIARLQVHTPICVEENLQELDLGVVDGISSFEAYERHRELFDLALTPTTEDFAFPAGEAWSTAADRITECVERMLAAYAGKTVCIVTHGGLLGLWKCRMFGQSLGAFREVQPKHASFSVVMKTGDNVTVQRWNDTYHLKL